MKPHHLLASAVTPDGGRLTLTEHDGDYAIRLNGAELMHSEASASESQMGELALEKMGRTRRVRVLIGGLGLGFTLRSVLGRCGPAAVVEVVELVPEVVAWNREHLVSLNGASIDDPRAKVVVDDVGRVLAKARPAGYDAILLDIDNGPVALVQADNTRIYEARGLERLFAVLKPGGRAVIWSAGPDKAFLARLKRAGFLVSLVPAKVHARSRRCAYTLFVADKPAVVRLD